MLHPHDDETRDGSTSSARTRRVDALVVGASQAGVQLAISLREEGFEGSITVVGAENHPPYQRPPLSKTMLHDGIVVESLAFRSSAFYEAHGIDLVLGTRVTSIQMQQDGAGYASTDGGVNFAFGRLALTVGARARHLSIEGAESDGVFYLRDAVDGTVLREALGRRGHVLVVGGGFIGLEVAATARALGCDVTVVLADPRLMARAVSEAVSDFFLRAHQDRGTNIRVSTTPVRVIPDETGRVCAVELSDGTTIETSTVVVGIGSQPRTELAEAMGLTVDNGIVVDGSGLTSDGFTLAAGDCVSCPNPVGDVAGPARVRFESVSTAIEQAKVAAATWAGRRATYAAVPWFWSDQFDLKLQAAGVGLDRADVVMRGDAGSAKFSVLSYDGDRLIGIESVNSPADFVAARKAMSAGMTIPRDAAQDVGQPLKKSVREILVAEMTSTS
jgi:3-phenylpropionate/trans-cinnamate dioxygenase ferredoxin reductase subunit